MEQPTTTFEGACGYIRSEVKRIGEYVSSLKTSVSNRDSILKEDKGEMLANLTLCFRHLEDAAMRAGKAIQASQGGVSIYDNKDAERASGVTKGPLVQGRPV